MEYLLSSKERRERWHSGRQRNECRGTVLCKKVWAMPGHIASDRETVRYSASFDTGNGFLCWAEFLQKNNNGRFLSGGRCFT